MMGRIRNPNPVFGPGIAHPQPPEHDVMSSWSPDNNAPSMQGNAWGRRSKAVYRQEGAFDRERRGERNRPGHLKMDLAVAFGDRGSEAARTLIFQIRHIDNRFVLPPWGVCAKTIALGRRTLSTE